MALRQPAPPRTAFTWMCDETNTKVVITILKPNKTEADREFARGVEYDADLRDYLGSYTRDLNLRLADATGYENWSAAKDRPHQRRRKG